MKLIYSEKCLNYKQEWHPESPQRIKEAVTDLKKLNYEFIEPEPCTKEELQLIHTDEHIENVKNNNFYDPDSPNYKDIYEFARLSAGAAIRAAQTNSFSLMRPPGHHAGPDYVMGFCYFNSLAIAVEKMGKKTLIIDIDAHHGNGTQDIFKDREDIVYISLHKKMYPGTGRKSFSNCYNHTFANIPGDDEYYIYLDKLLDSVKDIDFEMIAVSAGFDAYEGDPLSPLGITEEGYMKIASRIAELNLPIFCVLEGGYNASALGMNIHYFITGLEA